MRRPLQDVLTCIRHGVPLTGAGRLTRPNGEHDLKPPHAFAERWALERQFSPQMEAAERDRKYARWKSAVSATMAF